MSAEVRASSRRAGLLQPRFALFAAGALIVVAGVAVVVVSGREERTDVEPGTPREVTLKELREFAETEGHAVYWAGSAAPGERYELTTTRQGRVFVRYLPSGARIGDERPAYTAVGTYPLANAYAVTARTATRRDRVRRRAPGGGLAVWSRARPRSVYLAYPGSDYLVEVFAPRFADATQLALSGRVGPIR